MTDVQRARDRMMDVHIKRRGVRDQRVLAAMRAVPRERFVEPGLEEFAYEDAPLPIAEEQTISQPFIVAAMIEAAEARLANVRFEQGDAEHPAYAASSFDRLFCASALVLMSDINAALRCWRDLRKPGGTIAFDTAAKPFGFSQRASEAALRHGVRLSYGEVADTPERCRDLLVQAGFEVVDIRKAFANTNPVAIDDVIAMYDERLDHPAWRGIKEARAETREAIRADFIGSAIADAVSGYVPNDMALFFTTGRKQPS
ncbi:methyltransferase domain-containing protein [Sphingomonas sp. NPDC079357]|uniref:methyltransferase domain-containing protein n=1 Tax=Sphingomonas sp. NPDC079357 TaxID=3364518 RepID=UPI003850544B